jgi:hypothetical protein
VALVFAGTVVAAVLLERRLVGALERPLSPWQLVACGVVLTAGAFALRQVHLAQVTAAKRRRADSAYYLPTLLLAVTGLALSVPGTSAVALACFWLLLVVAELWQLAPVWKKGGQAPQSPHCGISDSDGAEPVPFFQSPGSAGASVVRQSPPPQPSDQRQDAARKEPQQPHGSQHVVESVVDLLEPGDGEDDEAAEALRAADVTQQMVRRLQADGRQAVGGMLRADFAAGERTVTAHLAFCPPLGVTPEFSAAAMAGPGAQVRATQILPYGVRMEIKLDVASRERVSVWIGFEACG